MSAGEVLGTSGCLAVVYLFMRSVCVLCQTGTLDLVLEGCYIVLIALSPAITWFLST